MILKIVLGLVAALVAFVVWRYTSVSRGAAQRDEALLVRMDPLAKKFEAREHVASQEIEAFASVPEFRPMLHALLEYHKRLDLFPKKYLSEKSQAESQLVYWMLHPNELQAAPASIALEEEVQGDFFGKVGTF